VKRSLGLEIGVEAETLHPPSLLKAVLRPHVTTPYDITEVISNELILQEPDSRSNKTPWNEKLNSGALKNLAVFQILGQTYFIRKFLHCCIFVVNSGQYVDMAFNYIFVGGRELSLTGPAVSLLLQFRCTGWGWGEYRYGP